MLDLYLVELAKVDQGAYATASTQAAAARTQDRGRSAGRRSGDRCRTGARGGPRVHRRRGAGRRRAGAACRGQPGAVPANPLEVKQRGRWLLHEGREQLLRGNYDAAQQKAEEVRALDVHWGLFEDNPEKLEKDINKARPVPAAPRATPPPAFRTTAGPPRPSSPTLGPCWIAANTSRRRPSRWR